MDEVEAEDGAEVVGLQFEGFLIGVFGLDEGAAHAVGVAEHTPAVGVEGAFLGADLEGARGAPVLLLGHGQAALPEGALGGVQVEAAGGAGELARGLPVGVGHRLLELGLDDAGFLRFEPGRHLQGLHRLVALAGLAVQHIQSEGGLEGVVCLGQDLFEFGQHVAAALDLLAEQPDDAVLRVAFGHFVEAGQGPGALVEFDVQFEQLLQHDEVVGVVPEGFLEDVAGVFEALVLVVQAGQLELGAAVAALGQGFDDGEGLLDGLGVLGGGGAAGRSLGAGALLAQQDFAAQHDGRLVVGGDFQHAVNGLLGPDQVVGGQVDVGQLLEGAQRLVGFEHGGKVFEPFSGGAGLAHALEDDGAEEDRLGVAPPELLVGALEAFAGPREVAFEEEDFAHEQVNHGRGLHLPFDAGDDVAGLADELGAGVRLAVGLGLDQVGIGQLGPGDHLEVLGGQVAHAGRHVLLRDVGGKGAAEQLLCLVVSLQAFAHEGEVDHDLQVIGEVFVGLAQQAVGPQGARGGEAAVLGGGRVGVGEHDEGGRLGGEAGVGGAQELGFELGGDVLALVGLLVDEEGAGEQEAALGVVGLAAEDVAQEVFGLLLEAGGLGGFGGLLDAFGLQRVPEAEVGDQVGVVGHSLEGAFEVVLDQLAVYVIVVPAPHEFGVGQGLVAEGVDALGVVFEEVGRGIDDLVEDLLLVEGDGVVIEQLEEPLLGVLVVRVEGGDAVEDADDAGEVAGGLLGAVGGGAFDGMGQFEQDGRIVLVVVEGLLVLLDGRLVVALGDQLVALERVGLGVVPMLADQQKGPPGHAGQDDQQQQGKHNLDVDARAAPGLARPAMVVVMTAAGHDEAPPGCGVTRWRAEQGNDRP
ncbi:MAG: hypothetical protein BWZ02_02598 [Lentisphaerae bacterium ADurb.BinA184]|nr:MAG: hypothetical protein BWZ02_02598 [Lentisphaerae bacterium ADurb.BinA184]